MSEIQDAAQAMEWAAQEIARLRANTTGLGDDYVMRLEAECERLGVDNTKLRLDAFAAQRSLEIYATDPHSFSGRPCGTCRTISILLSRPWGCAVREAKP